MEWQLTKWQRTQPRHSFIDALWTETTLLKEIAILDQNLIIKMKYRYTVKPNLGKRYYHSIFCIDPPQSWHVSYFWLADETFISDLSFSVTNFQQCANRSKTNTSKGGSKIDRKYQLFGPNETAAGKFLHLMCVLEIPWSNAVQRIRYIGNMQPSIKLLMNFWSNNLFTYNRIELVELFRQYWLGCYNLDTYKILVFIVFVITIKTLKSDKTSYWGRGVLADQFVKRRTWVTSLTQCNASNPLHCIVS